MIVIAILVMIFVILMFLLVKVPQWRFERKVQAEMLKLSHFSREACKSVVDLWAPFPYAWNPRVEACWRLWKIKMLEELENLQSYSQQMEEQEAQYQRDRL